RLVAGLHHLIAVDVVLHQVRRRHLLHEDVVRLHQEMLRLARKTRGDMVVGHVDEDEVCDQAVCGCELAAQLPLLGAHALADGALKLFDSSGHNARMKRRPGTAVLFALAILAAAGAGEVGGHPYATLADFAPISLLALGPLVLVAGPKLAPRTVGELVRLAKSRPGALNFAAVGPGSPARLLTELLELEAAIDVTLVPYKGAGLALGDLVAGQVDAMFATV